MVGADGEPPVLGPGGGVGEDLVHEVGQPPRLQDVADELRVGVGDDDDGGGQLLHRPPQQRLHVRGQLQTRHQGQDVLLDVHINNSQFFLLSTSDRMLGATNLGHSVLVQKTEDGPHELGPALV